MWVRVHIGDEIMKHTKGKWTSSHISEFEFDIIDENGRTISTVTNWNEQEANANLIASAPEMLKALKDSLFVLREHRIEESRQNELWDLIAKAEGGV